MLSLGAVIVCMAWSVLVGVAFARSQAEVQALRQERDRLRLQLRAASHARRS